MGRTKFLFQFITLVLNTLYDLVNLPSSPLYVLLSYPRSGGSVCAQIITNHSNIQLYSEVNPHYKYHSQLKKQAKDWHGISLKSSSFIDNVSELQHSNPSQQVLLRDFSFIDFTPHKQNCYWPTNRFNILQNIREPYTAFAIIRHPLHIWISRGCPPAFFTSYKNYLTALNQLGITVFTYESFCESPDTLLETMRNQLGLHIAKNATHQFSNNLKITGDSHITTPSIERRHKLQPTTSRALPQWATWVMNQEDYHTCCALSNYPVSTPSLLSYGSSTYWKRIMQTWLNRYPLAYY